MHALTRRRQAPSNSEGDMNPCCTYPLYDGARYVAILDFIYCILSITVITLQFINAARNGVAINFDNVPLSSTSFAQVLSAYLAISIINLALSVLLYRGVITDNLQKCRTFLIVSIISTTFGIFIVIYHGCHLSELSLSVFNSEFVIALVYHVSKLYALLVIIAFSRELQKLLNSTEGDANRRFQYQTLDSVNEDDASNPGEVAKHIIFNMPFSAKHYVPEENFRIDYNSCIEFEETTSTLKGTLNASPTFKRSITVKILKSNVRSEKRMIELVKEAKLWSYIGHHEHILQFVGICCTSSDVSRGNVMLLMESYVPRRLDDFLKNSFENQLQNFENMVVDSTGGGIGNGNNFSNNRLFSNGYNFLLKMLIYCGRGTLYENLETKYFNLEPFSTANMIQWAYQLSSAMEFLHERNIVLGNLQAKSILLVKISRIKLTNFGFASELHEENNLITSIYLSGKISWRWTAMECLCATNKGLPTEFNEKTDVWSYASTLWEIFSMGHAPNMSTNLSEYVTDLSSGKRLGKPDYASEGIYKLMLTCWSKTPSDRPGFNIISLFFRQLLSSSIAIEK
ncbi:Fibroblast growth factor receptor [Orchesella cincta]|uniref:Fibroblast growth factor receptor n=1 Tax=Orchesella cincta TaxID=48709 RepID=A0A1D2NA47_ORCCI|nr:Fibroblast growth factor receptor [Orchesella cincta]